MGPDCRRRSSEGSARKPPSRRVEDDRDRLGRHPKRTLYAGGGGLLSSLVSQAAPRLADLAMELVGTPLQQKLGNASDPTRRDNLYAPRTDALRGSQAVHARRPSMALQLQKLPSPLIVAGAVGLSALAFAARAATQRR